MDEDNIRAEREARNTMTDHPHNPGTQPLTYTALQTILPGETLHNTYEIQRFLKSGGMSEIYLANHVVLQKIRIVKIIKPELLNNPKVIDLFRREASLLSEIRNEAIVSYEGFFQDERNRCYLVMEYIDGPTLGEVIKQRKLSPEEIYILRDRLIYGLTAAHHPKPSSPGEPPRRPERHNPASIATVHWLHARALVRTLLQCPCCGATSARKLVTQ
jgi:serine/threonine protein kinase